MTSAQYPAIDAWIDAHFDEEVRFLQQLVQADWVSADYGSLRLLNLSSWRALHHGRYRAPAPNGRGVDMQAVIAWMGQFRRLPAPV